MSLTIAYDRAAHQPGRWRGRLRGVAGAAAGVVTSIVRPHTASLKRLADMPLAVLGTAGIDFAAFHVNHGIGWLAVGVSLWLIEHLIADPEDAR